MNGEFRGDFTRDSFDPKKHFSQVMMQQGRVMLDSEFNELQQILTHQLRTLAKTLIGDHGGFDKGFEIEVPTKTDESKNKFKIHRGSYYVDGILCENEEELNYSEQYWAEELPKPNDLRYYLVYLDAWERSIGKIQDESVLERALDGVDTAARSKIEWIVRTKYVDYSRSEKKRFYDENGEPLDELKDLIDGGKVKGSLKAQIKELEVAEDLCQISTFSELKGLPNLLYRVEVHRKGKAYKEEVIDPDPAATFKWSRMNGSVDFVIDKIGSPAENNDQTLIVDLKQDLAKDKDFVLAKGDWVEIVDDKSVLKGKTFPLWQVQEIESRIVTLKREIPKPKNGGENSDEFCAKKNPLLRRWDHKGESIKSKNGGVLLSEGALLIEEGKDINLENNIQITFTGGEYKSGDYWIIPARQATGGIDWPEGEFLSPHGVEHHIAPLAFISIKNDITTFAGSYRRVPKENFTEED